MKYLILLLTLFYSHPGKAQPTALSLKHLSLDVHRYWANREPMTPQIDSSAYRGAVQLNWDVGLVNDIVLWENRVYSSGTYSKFEVVSWEYRLSIPTRWGISPFIEHKSQHVMDREQVVFDQVNRIKYPVRDSYGVNFCFAGCK